MEVIEAGEPEFNEYLSSYMSRR